MQKRWPQEVSSCVWLSRQIGQLSSIIPRLPWHPNLRMCETLLALGKCKIFWSKFRFVTKISFSVLFLAKIFNNFFFFFLLNFRFLKRCSNFERQYFQDIKFYLFELNFRSNTNIIIIYLNYELDIDFLLEFCSNNKQLKFYIMIYM